MTDTSGNEPARVGASSGARVSAGADVVGAVSAARPAEGSPSEPVPPLPARARLTPSVRELLRRHRDGPPVTAGAVVGELLGAHPDYLDERFGPGSVEAVGATRTVAEHVDLATSFWDPAATPVLRGRHVVLGLALDATVGWPLLAAGVLQNLVTVWQPIRRQHHEPVALIWDLLTDEGRAAADGQPLLAAALGAPPEWSITFPADVAAVCWSPDGEQVAALVGQDVFRSGRNSRVARIGAARPGVLGLGWGRSGLVTLSLVGGEATLTGLLDGRVIASTPGVLDARITGDGTGAWLQTSTGLSRWSPAIPSPVPLGEPGRVLAVDSSGDSGLVERSDVAYLLTGIPRTGQPNWQEASTDPVPPDGTHTDPTPAPQGRRPRATSTTLGTRPSDSAALLDVDERPAAATTGDGGVVVGRAPFPPLARIATGPEPVTLLAADPTGHRLAAVTGRRVQVWTLSRARVHAAGVPKYSSDRADGPDLLEADRDARAVAALLASEDLRPPLAIGLFGPWGSGKSFVISRIKDFLDEFTGSKHAEGYLRAVRVIDFNAWNYAETNLWASLVDRVLQETQSIAKTSESMTPPEVAEAEKLADDARKEADAADRRVASTELALDQLTDRLSRQRRRAAVLAALVLVLSAATVIAVARTGPGRALAAATAVVALGGSAIEVLTRASQARKQATDVSRQVRELAETARVGVQAVERIAGRPEALAVLAGSQQLQRRQEEQRAARARADLLKAEATRMQELAEAQPLGVLLHRLATITEYRDELGQVSRTKEYFGQINREIVRKLDARRAARAGSAGSAAPGDHGPSDAGDLALERIVILIDDLDRCPPEKVVTVLEAVHLLFEFEMFAVLIAVDTRWLEQSLRIRYRQLLGRSGTAAPADFLEKIIQVPLHLVPLDSGLVRTMIENLTGASSDTPGDLTPPPTSPNGVAAPPPSTPPVKPEAAFESAVAQHPRPHRPALPAEVLRITPAEATAMAAVAPLVGSTPRTVKRFVNTYQLLKARAADPGGFDVARDGLGDHQVVALLLALVTGHPKVAAHLLPRLRDPVAPTLQTLLDDVAPINDPDGTQLGSLQAVRAWLVDHQDYACARADRYSDWAAEVARFSFTPPGGAQGPGAN